MSSFITSKCTLGVAIHVPMEMIHLQDLQNGTYACGKVRYNSKVLFVLFFKGRLGIQTEGAACSDNLGRLSVQRNHMIHVAENSKNVILRYLNKVQLISSVKRLLIIDKHKLFKFQCLDGLNQNTSVV